MKVTKLFLATLAAVLLPACTNEENSVADGDTPARATFTAAIDGQASTRAYDTSWEAGDAIGISGTTGGTAYTNVQYETGRGDGSFTAGTAGEEIYYQDNNAVTFTAYYPWNGLQRRHLNFCRHQRTSEPEKLRLPLGAGLRQQGKSCGVLQLRPQDGEARADRPQG